MRKSFEENSEMALCHFEKCLIERKLNQWRFKLVLNVQADDCRARLLVKYRIKRWIGNMKSIQRANILYLQAEKYSNIQNVRKSFNQWKYETQRSKDFNEKLKYFKEQRLMVNLKL